MSHDLSLQKNFALLLEAFRGTRSARLEHSRSLSSPVTIESGLALLRERWPDLQSPDLSSPVFIFSAGWRSGSTFLQRWVMTGKSSLVWGEPYCYAGLVPSLAGQLKAFTERWPQDEFFAAGHVRPEDLAQAWVANLYPSVSHFMNAHIGYFNKLFLEPALAVGIANWGLKEVTLRVEHACYLQWLFPNAKFIFLIRDPYDAYRSYRKWRNWYRAWPNEPVFTAGRFGALWRELADDFMKNHHKVGGLLLKYEELHRSATQSRLEGYLGFPVEDAASLAHVASARVSGPARNAYKWVPRLETLLLKRQVEPVSLELGYQKP